MAISRANITPELLVWARERLFSTKEEASERLGVSTERLEQWEAGQLSPTFNQAREIAGRLFIPFGYLFLSNPPSETPLPLPDLRTVAGTLPRPPSPNFLEVIHDAQRKQAWYRDELLGDRVSELEFVGIFQASSSFAEVAESIRRTVGIEDDMRRNSATWGDFLRELIYRAEGCGVLVLRSGVVGNNNQRKLDPSEFRGFALVDNYAPLIFVNGQDSRAAQIFTVAHELSHIWINESGVSNPDFASNSKHQSNQIETLCNRAAAEVLLPEREFLNIWSDSDTPSNNIESVARHFRVSTVAALRQALELGKMDTDSYRQAYASAVSRQKNTVPGGNFHNSLRARNSRRFVSAVISATWEGRLNQLDAARLLNVKVSTIESVSEKLYGVNSTDA